MCKEENIEKENISKSPLHFLPSCYILHVQYILSSLVAQSVVSWSKASRTNEFEENDRALLALQGKSTWTNESHRLIDNKNKCA